MSTETQMEAGEIIRIRYKRDYGYGPRYQFQEFRNWDALNSWANYALKEGIQWEHA